MVTPFERPAIALTGCLWAVACSGTDATRERCVSTIQSAPVPKECTGANSVPGIDVSVYQGSIDWKRVRSAGIGFAFARVSDGTRVSDTAFTTNWPAMKGAGIVRGAYQFFRPAEDPLAQANLFASMLDDAGGLELADLPVTMDLEVTDGVTDAELQSRAQLWLDAMQMTTGKTPIVYMPLDMGTHLGNRFDRYPLWVANWGVSCPGLPAGWSNWIFWQTSDNGMVAGIGDSVDRDDFNGPLGALQDFGDQGWIEAGSRSVPPDATSANGGAVNSVDVDARAPAEAAASSDAAAVDGASSRLTTPPSADVPSATEERGRASEVAGNAMGSGGTGARTGDAAGAIAPRAGMPGGQDCSP